MTKAKTRSQRFAMADEQARERAYNKLNQYRRELYFHGMITKAESERIVSRLCDWSNQWPYEVSDS